MHQLADGDACGLVGFLPPLVAAMEPNDYYKRNKTRPDAAPAKRSKRHRIALTVFHHDG